MSSRLQELIDRLCPDGVEYRKLGEIATVERGNGLQKRDFRQTGRPCIHYGQLYTKFDTVADSVLTYVGEETASGLKSLNTGDLLMAVTSENIEDVCKCIAWLGDDGVVVGGHTAIIRHSQDAKYLSYWFQTQDFFAQKKRLAHGTKVIEVTPKNLLDILIPVPPLEIQREIVQILDNFAELTAELTAELEKRKKQYEYYRGYLLNDWAANCKRVRLGNIASVERGNGLQKSDFAEMGVSCIHYGQIYTHFGISSSKTLTYVSPDLARTLKHVSPGDIVMAVTSENIEDVCKCTCWMGDEEIVTGGHTAIIRTGQCGKYLAYYFSTQDFFSQKKRLAHGTKVMEVTPRKLENVTIPLPPLAEQKRIVDILDRFDRLCNDLTAGLPAEIAARKKQYEYYRDKLLSFPPSPKGCGAAGKRKGAA